jgi:hypothetical protein
MGNDHRTASSSSWDSSLSRENLAAEGRPYLNQNQWSHPNQNWECGNRVPVPADDDDFLHLAATQRWAMAVVAAAAASVTQGANGPHTSVMADVKAEVSMPIDEAVEMDDDEDGSCGMYGKEPREDESGYGGPPSTPSRPTATSPLFNHAAAAAAAAGCTPTSFVAAAGAPPSPAAAGDGGAGPFPGDVDPFGWDWALS